MVSDRDCTYRLRDEIRSPTNQESQVRCTEPPTGPIALEEGRFCIFHNPSRSKKLHPFCEAIQQKGDSNYTGFVFPLEFDAKNLQLTNSNFTDAHFLDVADFSNETFVGPIQFEGARFDENAVFWGATFLGKVNFAQAIFSKGAQFSQASFTLSAHEAAMVGASNSRASNFVGANFSDVKFCGPANFDDADFMTPAYFGCAEFEEIVFFAGSSFSDFANVEFLMTKFRKECHFLEVHSLSVIEFVDCDFLDDADFRNSTLLGPMEFYRSAFAREARFGPISSQDGDERHLSLRFRETDLQRVTFRSADLRNVSFYHCFNLDKAEFSTCLWNGLSGRQRVLYDELALRGSKPIWGSESGLAIESNPPNVKGWERVETTYRDLRRNFEDRRDFAGSSDFYVGEMEMRRLAKPSLERQLISLEALYRHLSTYGENWWKPLLWLLGLTMVSGLVYAGWSIDFTMHLLSLLYSLSVLTFLRVSVAEPLHWTGQLMAILQLLISPILITLSVLAIRRKVKR